MLWASSIGGGRAIVRPQYKPEIEIETEGPAAENEADEKSEAAADQETPEGQPVV